MKKKKNRTINRTQLHHSAFVLQVQIACGKEKKGRSNLQKWRKGELLFFRLKFRGDEDEDDDASASDRQGEEIDEQLRKKNREQKQKQQGLFLGSRDDVDYFIKRRKTKEKKNLAVQRL